MKAMVLAAGLGTRLRPVTNTRPKALVEVGGVPLLELVLTRLIAAGVTEVILNLHHFPEQINAFLQQKDHFGIRIEFSHEETLLDTGGGLKNAGDFFDDNQPFILHNVDVISDIDLRKMVRAHESESRLATLAVNKRRSSRYLIFDARGLLCGWKSVSQNKEINAREPHGTTEALGFCGIHVLSPAIFSRLTEEGTFSIINSYLRLAGEGEVIKAFRVDEVPWRDVGKLSELG
ncbi:MAG: NDP-sugar synthase [bacterium]